jgi:hypothetical protein
MLSIELLDQNVKDIIWQQFNNHNKGLVICLEKNKLIDFENQVQRLSPPDRLKYIIDILGNITLSQLSTNYSKKGRRNIIRILLNVSSPKLWEKYNENGIEDKFDDIAFEFFKVVTNKSNKIDLNLKNNSIYLSLDQIAKQIYYKELFIIHYVIFLCANSLEYVLHRLTEFYDVSCDRIWNPLVNNNAMNKFKLLSYRSTVNNFIKCLNDFDISFMIIAHFNI